MVLTTRAVRKNSPLSWTAIYFEGHVLGEIAFGHGADDAGYFRGGLNHVADERVDGFDAIGPAAAVVSQAGALVDAALLADGV